MEVMQYNYCLASGRWLIQKEVGRITTVAQPWVVPVDNGIACWEGSNNNVWSLLLPVKNENMEGILVVPVERDKTWWECSINIAWPLLVIEERLQYCFASCGHHRERQRIEGVKYCYCLASGHNKYNTL